MNKPKVMVLLGGGRIAPNIAGVWSLRPDEVRYLISEDAPQTYEGMRGVLDQIPWLRANAPKIDVPAHDIVAMREKVRELIKDIREKTPNAFITFNATCGTKTMAIAVYEEAKSKCRVIYVDSFNKQILDWTAPQDNQPLTPCTLETYFANFGRRPEPTSGLPHLSMTEEKAVQLANLLVDSGSGADNLLLKMRQQGWSVGQQTRFLASVSDKEVELLQEMKKAGLLTDIAKGQDGTWHYTIPSAGNWNFIKGDWLELFVYDQAKSLKLGNGQPLFDEMAFGVKIPVEKDGGKSAHREIDFAGLYGWQLVWASCKVEKKPFQKKHLDEVSAVNALLGGRYATPLFICNGSVEDENFSSFQEQAKESRIVVVCREDLRNIADILKREAKKPTYRRV